MSIKAPFQSDPAHKVRKIIFQTCQTLHLPELDLTEALTFAKEMVMTFFIKQGREEIFLFGQLPHQFLLVLGRGHFLKHKFKKKNQPLSIICAPEGSTNMFPEIWSQRLPQFFLSPHSGL